jgi:hypothetical protein
MTDQLTEIVIEKKDAVFRMDANGQWHNQHGRFQHKKVIDYFHTCIQKDDHGFYLAQERDNCIEKVYFPYEETAYFVFNIIAGDDITLVLNTRAQLKLNPDALCLKDDSLYMRHGEDILKFTDRSMMKIAAFLEERNGGYDFVYKEERYPIKAVKSFQADDNHT